MAHQHKLPTRHRGILLAAALLTFVAPGQAAFAQDGADGLKEVVIRDIDASGDNPTYVSLSLGKTVGADEEWDLSFKGTDIGVSGAAQVVDRAFKRIVEAPEDGWKTDGDDGPAISKAEDVRWFEYDPTTHIVTPVPFRTILLRTKSGQYAKMEILDYYDAMDTPRFYSIRYVLQTEAGAMGLGTSESDG